MKWIQRYELWVACVLTGMESAYAVEAIDFSRYQVILDRAPFGAVQEASAATPEATVVPPEQSFIRDWRLVGMTEEGGEIQVGLANVQNNNAYLLYVGDMVEDVTVLAADYEKESVQLQKGSDKQWLGMDEASLGGGGAGVVSGQGGNDSEVGGGDRVASSRRASRRRETSRHREVETPKLTGVELEKHLRDYQMELIRTGAPPLPMPLTKEMDDQLVREGVLPPVK